MKINLEPIKSKISSSDLGICPYSSERTRFVCHSAVEFQNGVLCLHPLFLNILVVIHSAMFYESHSGLYKYWKTFRLVFY